MEWHGANSIFVRQLAVVLSLVLLCVAPLAYFALEDHSEQAESRFTSDAHTTASGLASAAFDPLLARNFSNLQSIVEEMARSTPVDALMVTTPDGRILAHSDPDYIGSVGDREIYEQRYFLSVVPVRQAEGKPLALAFAGVGRQRLDQEIKRFLVTFSLILLSSLAVGVAGVVLFSLRLTRPVRRLTEAASGIAGGNLDIAVDGHFGPAEIEEMADAFERMRLSLRSHVERLERSGAMLDRKVQDISLLYSVSEAMNAGDYSEGMLDLILGSAVEGVHAHIGLLALSDEDAPQRLRVVSCRGTDRHSQGNPRLSAMLEQASLAILRQETIRVEGLCAGVPGAGAQITVPLIVEGNAAGAMTLGREKGVFSLEDQELAVGLASHAARCVERARLYEASIKDGLTGLHVSRYFALRLREELKAAARYNRPLSLVMVDVDFFKAVNDTYGHQAGDRVLKAVAYCISETVRDGMDLAARYGGEEFAVVLPETDSAGAAAVADRIRTNTACRTVHHEDHSIAVTLSAGVATFPEDGADVPSLVAAADRALYEAKRSGRNRVVVHTHAPVQP